MKVTDNISTDPFTKQKDMKTGDVFILDGQPKTIVVFAYDDGTVANGRYTLDLRTGVMNVGNKSENNLVLPMPKAELLLRGRDDKD